MKIFSKEQLAQIDRRTIEEENIPETELMERASLALAGRIETYYPPSSKVAVVAGPGNNGGDALAVARILSGHYYTVDVYLPELGGTRTIASQIYLDRLRDGGKVRITELREQVDFPGLAEYDFILDGLYGSGLSRPLAGFAATVIGWINGSGKEVLSIDLPSGLMCDENRYNQGAILRATRTLTLEFPKLSLFFRENEPFFGNWTIVPFGLSPKAAEETATSMFFLDQESAAALLKHRKTFSHKGSYGHGLLIAGSKGKYGAAHLAARGSLRAGLGLLTVHLPESAGIMLGTALPEAMTSIDNGIGCVTELPELLRYSAIAAGPGIGMELQTQNVIGQLIEQSTVPTVLDADALNILAIHPEWLRKISTSTILTPHPVEFDRLSGIVVKTEEERFFMAREFAASYGVILVLKGAYTRIFFPEGTVSFNSTGNPGMATAGSGDVLTGILLGLLGQGYTPREAVLLGVFLHGRSADLRVKASSEESLIASEIADFLGEAFASIK